jgi:hypothetical protein
LICREYGSFITCCKSNIIFSAYQPVTVAGLSEIDKKYGTNNGNITIRLFGGGLADDDDFQLRTSSGEIIEPIMHTNPESGVIEAVFDLSGKTPSLCDVIANVSGNEQVLKDAFEIIQAPTDFEYDLSVEFHGYSVAIFNLWQTYTIVLGNNSDIDAYSVPFGLAISDFPELEVEFMDFEIESPERGGYEFPQELSDLEIYSILDEVNGEQINARVYPLIIPVIPANSTVSLRIRIKSPEDLSLRGWLMEPIVGEENGDGGIIKERDKFLLSQAKIDLAMCMIKILGEGAIDIGTAAIPGVGCAWAVGKNLYKSYQDPPKTEKRIWSFIYDWGVTVVDCGVNLSGIGNVVKAGAVFFANMYGYAKSYNECIKQGIKSGAIKNVNMAWSFDPNEITGPLGFGDEGYIKPQGSLPYTIYFENKPDASAPAHIVTVLDTLNKMYSREKFRFGAFGFGDEVYLPSSENPFAFAQDIQMNDEMVLRVSGDFDTKTGIITWLFQSLDPITMDIHEDPMQGFLPPNINSPEGEGFVSYTAFPLEKPIDGEVFENRAKIIFDANEPIITNTWVNTIDDVQPESSVAMLENISDRTFMVDWSGDDSGSGIYYYDVYVSIDGGEYIPWLLQTRESNAEFLGEKGKQYSFYSIATDKAGNLEETPPNADASTTITSVKDDISDKITLYPNPADEIAYLSFESLESQRITIEIYSTKAGKIYEDKIFLNSKTKTAIINTIDFSSGIYFVKITTNSNVIYKNLVVKKGCR